MFSTNKRIVDFCLSLLVLLVMFVPLLIIALLIKLDSKGPVFFWSLRIGQASTEFSMPKFRTMYITAPNVPTNSLATPNSHITRIGKFLRKYSLDELPQFYSVLKGDMSIIGPRPMMPEMTDILDGRENCGVSSLRPGITGWAQINGRDNLTWKEKLCLDEEYLRRQSILFDIQILLRTIVYVFRAKDVLH